MQWFNGVRPEMRPKAEVRERWWGARTSRREELYEPMYHHFIWVRLEPIWHQTVLLTCDVRSYSRTDKRNIVVFNMCSEELEAGRPQM
jgi:hypothetical protein